MSTSTDQVSVPADEALGTGRRGLVLKVAGLLVLAVIAIAFPKVYTDPAVTNYGVFALIYVTVASAWNIFSGNTGYISLGHGGVLRQRRLRARRHGVGLAF